MQLGDCVEVICRTRADQMSTSIVGDVVMVGLSPKDPDGLIFSVAGLDYVFDSSDEDLEVTVQ